jgi:hypothetical protein
VVPGRPGSGGPAKFRRAAAGLGQGKAWGGAKGPRGPVLGHSWGWGGRWQLGRRRGPAVAAAVTAPVRVPAWLGSAGSGRLR